MDNGYVVAAYVVTATLVILYTLGLRRRLVRARVAAMGTKHDDGES